MAILLLASFSLNESLEKGDNVLRFPNSVGGLEGGGSDLQVPQETEEKPRYFETTLLGLKVSVDGDKDFSDTISFSTFSLDQDLKAQGFRVYIGSEVYGSLMNINESFEKANQAIKNSKIGLGNYHTLSNHLKFTGSKDFGFELRPIEVDAVLESGAKDKVFSSAYSEIEGFDTLQEFLQSLSSSVLSNEKLLSNEKIHILDQFFSQLPNGPAKQYLMNQLLAKSIQEAEFDPSEVEKLSIVASVLKGQNIDIDSPDIAVNPVCEFLAMQASDLAASCSWDDQIEISEFIDKLNLIQETYDLDLETLKCTFPSRDELAAKANEAKKNFWKGFAQVAKESADYFAEDTSDGFLGLEAASEEIKKISAGYRKAFNSEGEEVWYKASEDKETENNFRGKTFAHSERSNSEPLSDDIDSERQEDESSEKKNSIGFSIMATGNVAKPDKCSPRRLASAIRDIKSGVNKEAGSMGDTDVNEVYKVSGRGSEGDSVDLKVTLNFQSSEPECQNKDLKNLLSNLLDDFDNSKKFSQLHTFQAGKLKMTSEARCQYGIVLDGSIERMNANTLNSAVFHRVRDGVR